MSRAVCPRCGSVGTRPVKGGLLQRLVAVLRRQAVIYCPRCGWRGRQKPLAERLPSMPRASTAVDPSLPSPDLTALDGQLDSEQRHPRER